MNNREVAKEIKELHTDILNNFGDTLQKSIDLGKILLDQKTKVGHGNFIEWIEKYCPFSERTARNYITLNHHKTRLLEAKVNSLNEAYRLISNFRIKKIVSAEAREYRNNFANSESKYTNPKSYVNKVICGDNHSLLKQMLDKGMSEKYTAVITSPPYNANMNYGDSYNDNKKYEDYMEDLLKPFYLYSKLLRSGGRVIYIIGTLCRNENKEVEGDYNNQITTDLLYEVRKRYKEFRFNTQIVWDKGSKRKNPLDNRYGTFCSPLAPVVRSCHEAVLVWSKDKFELENITGEQPDITKEEFMEWSWSVWGISTYTRPNNPHPCSFPSRLIERLLRFYTYPKDLILDPYCGAGVTGTACKKLNREFTLIDINPAYCKYASEQVK